MYQFFITIILNVMVGTIFIQGNIILVIIIDKQALYLHVRVVMLI